MSYFDLMAQHFIVCVALYSLAADVDASEPIATFEKVVAPSLAAKCVSCHRPDNLKGGLDLSTRAGAMKGGNSGPALVPGDPSASPIYTRTIARNGQTPEMPAKGQPLTEVETQALQDWIKSGAVWPIITVLREKAKADAEFWSFQPIADLEPPNNTSAPDVWNRNPIDQFVFARLQSAGLSPNPPADPRTFIRRATFDLNGLPPTPEEVSDFISDVANNGADAATEHLIDRLLESPRYGETWGRHWLDVIRFGESRGYERNEIITNLWPFRDYIIQSFNTDKPFDQLILEHLAGDVIGKDQPEIEIGSAFLVAGPYDDVGNQDPVAAAQIRADQMDEMIRATSEAFLGLTMGCARCHDHKFDPIPTQDYYSFFATFSGTFHGQRVVSKPAEREAQDSRLLPLQEERKRLTGERNALNQVVAERIKQHEPEVAKSWIRPRHSRYLTEERFDPVNAAFIRLTVEGTDASDSKRKQFKLDEFEVWTEEENARNVALAVLGGKATGASPNAKDFAGAYSADLVIDGKFGECWIAEGDELVIQFAKPERISKVVFSSDRARSLDEESSLTVFVGDYRIEISLDGEQWTDVASSADRLPPTEARRNARLRKVVTTAEEVAKFNSLNQQLSRIDQQIAQIPPLPVSWVGNHRGAPGPFAVFVGGNPQRRGDEVFPASLTVLNHLSSNYQLDRSSDEAARRLALARWLTANDQPLTPRVLINRIWQYHFGTGIVSTPSDFGYMGGRPTHPELLNWLSRELLRRQWKWKPLHRLIMTSQTYRQSSALHADRAQKDADSRLLWRFPPRRLTAEQVRDTLLAVSGKLQLTMGGPGFRLYEYQQDNVATYVPLDDHGPDTFRRSVYHHNARASRVDVLTDFDCPDPASAEPRRAVTTTPLQALTLLNHQFSHTMANAFADRLLCEEPIESTQVSRAFLLAYSREPVHQELLSGVKIIKNYGLRAFCRAILNSNELIHVD